MIETRLLGSPLIRMKENAGIAATNTAAFDKRAWLREHSRSGLYSAEFGDHILYSAFSISPARSPMITQGAIVLPVVTRGMIDPSTIRTLSIP
jgi:hypothetical protein